MVDSGYGTPGQNGMKFGDNPHPSLFGPKGVQVRTSEQGDLGDCWFLSSATALAQYPQRIHDIFGDTQEYNENGAFNMQFYVRGEPVYVHIDDRIPMEYYGNDYYQPLLFMNNRRSQDGAWWLVLLEKAMAKLNVNYSNLNAGRPGQALRALSGQPVVNYFSRQMSEEEVWNVITDGMHKHYSMVGGTGQSPADGVTPGHAETCLGSLVLRNPDGSVHERLIKMRNPWGKYEYNGPWSRGSVEWNDDFKRQADYAEADDGIFYTPLRLWREEYENLAIAHYNVDWQINEISGERTVYSPDYQQHSWISFDNPTTQDVLVECDAYTSRLWPSDDCKNQHNYPQDYQAYLFEGADNTYSQMQTYPAQIQCNGEAFLLNNLAPGTYNIGIWNFDGSDNGHGIFKVRTYAAEEVAMLRLRRELTQDNQQ